MVGDWRENLLESIRKPEFLATRANNKNKFILQAHVPPLWVHLFDKVTAQMDYSQASWVRRSLAIPLSRQSGVPLEEILGLTTQVRRRGVVSPRYPDEGRGDTGRDMHLWCLHPGCDGDHFRVD